LQPASWLTGPIVTIVPLENVLTHRRAS